MCRYVSVVAGGLVLRPSPDRAIDAGGTVRVGAGLASPGRPRTPTVDNLGTGADARVSGPREGAADSGRDWRGGRAVRANSEFSLRRR